MANEMRVTKRQYFEALKTFVGGGKLAYPTDDVVAFINHEVELLDKKSSVKKPTKTQVANEGFKTIVTEVLGVVGKPVTVTELIKADERFTDVSNQKMSSMLRQLVESGEVVKTTDKKVSRFALS